MKINRNHEWGKYTEQLILQVVMSPGLLKITLVSWLSRPPSPAMNMALGWSKENKDDVDIQGFF